MKIFNSAAPQTNSFDDVLDNELDSVQAARGAKELPRASSANQPSSVQEKALQQDLIGLAISGGGIRSATLSLGILQGLATKGLLKHIDYLSTVSGGGYIGSWLISFLRRRSEGRAAKASLEHLEDALTPDSDSDPEPLLHLRSYSNYLTPRTSLLSADTWTLAATWARNTLLNFAIIVGGLAALLLLPRFAGYYLSRMPASGPIFGIEPVLIALCLVIVAVRIGGNLLKVGDGQPGGAGQTGVQWTVVIPLLIASAAMTVWMLRVPSLFVANWLLFPTIVFTILYSILGGSSGFPKFLGQENERWLGKWLGRAAGYVLTVVWSGIAALLTTSVLHGLALLLNVIDSTLRPFAALTIGPPLILFILALGMILLTGLMGHDLPDGSREWLARARAWTLIYSAGWLLITGISIYGPFALYWAGSSGSLSIGAIWGAISATGVFGGKSEKNSGQPTAGVDWKALALDAVTRVAPFVFILGFATLIAFGIHELVSQRAVAGTTAQPLNVSIANTPDPVTLTIGQPAKPLTHFQSRYKNYGLDLASGERGRLAPSHIDFYNLDSLFLLAVALCLFLSWRVDINDFSMFHFYKNRLVRCYMGASRTRKPDPFTGFDKNDDLPLKEFAPEGSETAEDFANEKYCGPYPILNGALNLAGGTPLAWQERQAASFTFTPRYCGYDKPLMTRQSEGESGSAEPPLDAYVPTAAMSYKEGFRVGTAMAISGAAANPNAGYHTSTAVAFLLTLFNVRLGWWLGNPGHGRERNHGPSFGLTYLLTELFGLANANKAYVNVSDGGHFENLGIYELAKRRCRYIIVCDGEQDREMKFEGLANAIRKCRVDFGVEIDIDVGQLRLKDGISGAHCVVGAITYPEEKGREARPAYLLYLKASLTGNEDTDVLQYHSTHADFPHESTADQWFDESQFESYRKLGLHIAGAAFTGKVLRGPYPNDETYKAGKKDMFDDLRSSLYPPSETIQKSFTRHTDSYTRLVEEVARQSSIGYLDSTIFEKWSVPVDPNKREGRYLCTSFIQLMENVYLDLRLDDPKQLGHPHNAGWLKLFTTWASSRAFQDAWEIAGPTYGERFRKFYENLQPPKA